MSHIARIVQTALVLAFFSGAAVAQSTIERWAAVPEGAPPVASGHNFDLAFGADQLPVLAFLESANPTLNVKKWNGSAWTNLTSLTFQSGLPLHVTMASNWTGDVVVGLLVSDSGGGISIRVFLLRGAQLQPLGPAFGIPALTTYAVAIDARGPVVALKNRGFFTVRRWNGVSWTQLGSNVNSDFNTFFDPQSPSLAVTGDGKLVVAYAEPVGDGVGVVAKVWDGSGWTALGTGVPAPADAVSLGGENSGTPVAAYRSGGSGGSSRVSRWNGSTWVGIGQPCVPTILDAAFGIPSLTVRGNQPLVVCGIHVSPNTVTGRRTLLARAWSRLSGWEPVGRGSINGATALADVNLAYVVRSDPRGRPWVAWMAQSGVFVSTLVPAGLSPGP